MHKFIQSMYGVFTYVPLILMVNVGKYTIHGSYGKCSFFFVLGVTARGAIGFHEF